MAKYYLVDNLTDAQRYLSVGLIDGDTWCQYGNNRTSYVIEDIGGGVVFRIKVDSGDYAGKYLGMESIDGRLGAYANKDNKFCRWRFNVEGDIAYVRHNPTDGNLYEKDNRLYYNAFKDGEIVHIYRIPKRD